MGSRRRAPPSAGGAAPLGTVARGGDARPSEIGSALAAHSDLLAVVVTMADPRGLTAGLAHDRHVRDVDELLDVDDAALLTALRRPRMLLGPGHALDHDPALPGQDTHDPAPCPTVLAVDHLDLVVLLDAHAGHVRAPPAPAR